MHVSSLRGRLSMFIHVRGTCTPILTRWMQASVLDGHAVRQAISLQSVGCWLLDRARTAGANSGWPVSLLSPSGLSAINKSSQGRPFRCERARRAAIQAMHRTLTQLQLASRRFGLAWPRKGLSYCMNAFLPTGRTCGPEWNRWKIAEARTDDGGARALPPRARALP